jgi:hypothetical protein
MNLRNFLPLLGAMRVGPELQVNLIAKDHQGQFEVILSV